MNRKQISYYIPTADNNGVPIAATEFRHLKNKLISYFGPHTIYPSLRGIWLNQAGVRFDDPIMLIQIVAEERPDLMARISDIVALVLERFDQEEVFVTVGDVDVLSFGNGQDHQPWKGDARNSGLPIKLYEPLTIREIDVLALVVEGKQNKEIARELVIEVPTVEHHLHNIFRKLGVCNRTHAATIALSNRIIQSRNNGKPLQRRN